MLRIEESRCCRASRFSSLLSLVGCLVIGALVFPGSFLAATRRAKATAPTLSSRVAPAKPTARGSAKKRRHRRLKLSRSRKPMPPLSEAPFGAEVPLLPLIEAAKSRLEQESVRYVEGTRPSLAVREIKLALANFKSGEIQIVSGVEASQKLTLQDSAVQYTVEWWNGFNSSITIADPPDTAVVAMLYALEPERQRFLGYDAIIYTPYSNALLQTELVEAGKAYLIDKIQQARQELGHVPSRAFPGMSLAITPAFRDEDYFNLILTEQMDPGRFRSIAAGSWEFTEEQESELTRLAERILVIVGANQEDAYSFTGNYASARGLTQFTPMGMSVVWTSYPEAGIPRDFREATSSHLHAIKAEICLLDHELASMASSHPALISSGMEVFAAGAAYNGGPKRVRYGLENFGLAWLHPISRLAELSSRSPLSQSEKKEQLWLKRNRSHETFVYLNKIHAIQRSQEKLSANRSLSVSEGN